METNLSTALAKVRRSIKQVRDRKERIGEEATKTALIAPVLAALGWDTTNLDEVFPEYKHKPKANPVDYALLLRREPCLFVEAKPLDTNLDDLKWKNQVVGYASSCGVEWFVLTDGDTYCIYKTRAKGDVDQKLFRRVTVTDTDTEQHALETLELLSKSKFDTVLEEYWAAESIDRKVQTAVAEAFSEPGARLVRLIRDMAGLKPSEVRKSLQRGNVIIDFPPLPATEAQAREERPEGPAPSAAATGSEVLADAYQGPLERDDRAFVVQRRRRFAGGLKPERASVGAVRGVAEAVCALARAGVEVSIPSIRAHEAGPASYWATHRALGCLQVAGCIEQDKVGARMIMRPVGNLTAEDMVRQVTERATQTTRRKGKARPDRPRKFKAQFRWALEMDEDGSFTIDCRYLPDESRNFRVSGRRVAADQDFRPARKQLFEDVYRNIKPLFPELPDGRVRAKAWSGVHKVYPAHIYGSM